MNAFKCYITISASKIHIAYLVVYKAMDWMSCETILIRKPSNDTNSPMFLLANNTMGSRTNGCKYLQVPLHGDSSEKLSP